MCGSSGGAGTHSTCGSYFNTGTKEFSGVPYSSLDFNDNKCYTSNGEIQNYGDVNQVRYCVFTDIVKAIRCFIFCNFKHISTP